jgi:hypothetical protein
MRGVFCGLVAVFFAGAVWGFEAPVYIGTYSFAHPMRKNQNEQLVRHGLGFPTDHVGLPKDDAALAAALAAPEPLTRAEQDVLPSEVAAYKRGTGEEKRTKKLIKTIPKKWVAGCACLKQHNELIGEIIALERSETKENLAEVETAIVEKYGAVRANYEVHKTTCPQRKTILWTPASLKY